MPHILMIATGGTIACCETERGLSPALDGTALLGALPELSALCTVETLDLMQLDSTDVTAADRQRMAQAVWQNREKFDGFVLTHGTDTLAYTAALLTHLLPHFDKPLVLTGSMLPAGAPGSDAWDNLVGALRVLQEGHARGVQVYFNDALLHGARVSKLRSDAFDAFAELPRPRHAEHAPVPAALGYRQPRREVNLAVLPLYPGLRAAHLRGLLDSGVEALLLECYGSGTGPSDDEELLALLREAHARGVLLAAVSQCAYGQVEFGVYAAGSRLRDAGLLSAGGMTREAALGKLFGLLGAGLGRDEAQRWFALDLCGENAD